MNKIIIKKRPPILWYVLWPFSFLYSVFCGLCIIILFILENTGINTNRVFDLIIYPLECYNELENNNNKVLNLGRDT